MAQAARSGKSYDPAAWAAQRRAAVERANRLRAERKGTQEPEPFSSPQPTSGGGQRGQGGGGGNDQASLDQIAADSLDQFYAAEAHRTTTAGKENARVDENWGDQAGGQGSSQESYMYQQPPPRNQHGRIDHDHIPLRSEQPQAGPSPSSDALGMELRRQGHPGQQQQQQHGGFPANKFQHHQQQMSQQQQQQSQSQYQQQQQAAYDEQQQQQQQQQQPRSGGQGRYAYQGEGAGHAGAGHTGRPDLMAQAFPDDDIQAQAARELERSNAAAENQQTFEGLLRSPERAPGQGRGRGQRRRQEAPGWNSDTTVNNNNMDPM
eukprot:CAMPEP_0182601702 /NCGR_PEP_ID=MMETSP1324-20130603/91618_1 /TAXON_ID=236786 /ORGANISM="Florenciella sp., Strain RCC1587" /LENGTH=319 /DNA_ID=CAMNT_0024819617 /DNA_START=85 /DNA_END=1041 /DNA_ORIENTATION=+